MKTLKYTNNNRESLNAYREEWYKIITIQTKSATLYVHTD